MTKFIGQQIYFFESLDSTNDKAKELARQGSPEGTIIIAKTQTAGKGQGGHHWFSPEGGIYLSIILRPPDSALNRITQLVFIGAQAGAEALRKIIPPALSLQIKHPNDLYINQKKVGGILLESNLQGDKINFVILGIGINLGSDIAAFPEEIKEQSFSLKDINFNPPQFIRILLEEIENEYETFLHEK